ncbi:MAG: hypothetical protein FXF47_05795 [Candidatus Mcinerneyibacterium aminivorans]|uniref:Uncharacterized protein n=1 Tax=Candidatus Mcinerneyibacterium aminivorans TaxID=2703815 RepID=A0A5D0MFB7_9BACT|nr:MAG: hypothetical protein FXF47_05795 [Candidatus Mcinerneyibacterium aminivorans]
MIYILIIILVLIAAAEFYYLLKFKKKYENEKKNEKSIQISEDDIVITKALDNGNVKAYITIKVNEAIVLKDMKVIALQEEDGKEKLKIEVPARITNKGHLLDIYKFIDYDFRQKLFDTILKKYKNL